MSSREIDGGGHNRLFGPDFRWQLSDNDVLTGQFLVSESRTPDRPELAAEWDRRDLSGHAARVWWSHRAETWDLFASAQDIADEFRADNGFVPQVGFRQLFAKVSYAFQR